MKMKKKKQIMAVVFMLVDRNDDLRTIMFKATPRLIAVAVKTY